MAAVLLLLVTHTLFLQIDADTARRVIYCCWECATQAEISPLKPIRYSPSSARAEFCSTSGNAAPMASRLLLSMITAVAAG